MPQSIIECPHCGTRMRIPGTAGAKVRCPHCKNVLEAAPEEAPEEILEEAPEESEDRGKPASPRARASRGGKGRGGEPEEEEEEDDEEDDETRSAERGTRKGKHEDEDGGPTRNAERGTRKKGTRAIPKRPGKGKSNKMVLIALGGVAVLVLVAVVAVALALPKDNPQEEGKNGKTQGAGKAEDAKKAEREKKLLDYRGRAGEGESVQDFLALGEEAEGLGLGDEAKGHFEKVLELEPENERALAKLHYERYELPASASGIPPELLGDLQAQAGKWLPPAEVKKVREKEKEILAAARAEVDKREKDPFYARMADILKSIENVQGFKDYLFLCQRSDPYLLIEHVGKKGFNPYRSDEAKKLAEQKVEGLKKVYDFVMQNFIQPAGLKRDETRPLAVVSFEDRKVFEEFQKAIGMDLPPGAQAYFSPVTKFVVMYNDAAATYGPEEETQSTLFHEATHQIFDAYANADGSMNVRLSLWCNEGLAEYVASLRLKPALGGTFETLIAWEMKSGRLAEFYSARFPKKFKERTALGVGDAYHLSLEEMVQMFHAPQCLEMVMRKWVQAGGSNPGEVDAGMRDNILATAGSLIYAEASSFMFFCLKGKPDTYKAPMMEYLKRELTGRATTRNAQTFKEVFGKDLAKIEKEWLEYVDSKTTASIKDGHMR
jgi:predicted Zn finger-like uncharacterized protein